ncbi:DOPA-like domain-containing protein [Mycena galericulata]|nr:DOPA-like domain-containing protein [Mycena galericulata]
MVSDKYPSPLKGYENAEPLPNVLSDDGQSLYNPPAKKSPAYDQFVAPITTETNGFDFQVYYRPSSAMESQYARELHERIRREFPELRIYKLWDEPMGPHPTAMFEIGTFTPHETGALFSWLVVFRGPLSVLVHPITDDKYRDHSELVTWMGPPWPLYAEYQKGTPYEHQRHNRAGTVDAPTASG